MKGYVVRSGYRFGDTAGVSKFKRNYKNFMIKQLLMVRPIR